MYNVYRSTSREPHDHLPCAYCSVRAEISTCADRGISQQERSRHLDLEKNSKENMIGVVIGVCIKPPEAELEFNSLTWGLYAPPPA